MRRTQPCAAAVAAVFTAATLAFSGSTAPVLAQTEPAADPLAAFYANTLRIEVKGSKEFRFYSADHTFRDRIHGNQVSGTWTVEGDRICAQFEHGSKYCNLGVGKTVGETWTDHDPYTGNEVKFTLVEGRKADR